jgi:Tol biopolymer transport system component
MLRRIGYTVACLALLVYLSANLVSAQSTGKPGYIIAFVPMKWSGSLDAFDREATAQGNVFIRESGIEKYARVEIKLIHERLDNVDLKSYSLLPIVVAFGLSRAPADRYVGLTNGDIAPGGSSSVVGYTYGNNSNGLVVEAGDQNVAAHELGHTFGLCDEYSFVVWEAQNQRGGCPNPYPPDCPRTKFIDCLGNKTPNGGRSIMGPAGLTVLREFDQSARDHFDKTFARMFGPPVPPTPTPIPTPMPTPVPQAVAFVNNSGGSFQLYIADSMQSQPHAVGKVPGNIYSPSWSPDGTHLAFAANTDEGMDIYSISATGSDLKRLTNQPGHDESPSWSPDGQFIAFVSDREGSSELYLMHADGSKQIRVTNSAANVRWPTWSPDNRRIAFASDREGRFQLFILSLVLVPDVRVLDMARFTSSDATDTSPAWSPDGRQIAFASNRDGPLKIYVGSVEGASLRRITTGPFNDWAPAWLKEQDGIIYQTARAGTPQLYGVRMAGGDEQPLFGMGGTSAAPAIQR